MTPVFYSLVLLGGDEAIVHSKKTMEIKSDNAGAFQKLTAAAVSHIF